MKKVHVLTGTYLSNVGLAVAHVAASQKTVFLAAEPLTGALKYPRKKL